MTAVLRSVDVPVLEAARRRKLSVRGRYWLCGDRSMNSGAVRRLLEDGLLRVDITEAGTEALSGPTVFTRGAYDKESRRRSPADFGGLRIALTPAQMKRLRERGEQLGTDARGYVEALIAGKAHAPKPGPKKQPKPAEPDVRLSPKYRDALARAAADRGSDAAAFGRFLLGRLLRDQDLMREVIGR